MKIERSLSLLLVLPMTAALQSSVLAQDGSLSFPPVQPGLTQGVSPAYSIGLTNPVLNQTSSSAQASLLADVTPSTSDAASSATAYGTPSTADSAMALATTSDQLTILERFLFNHTNAGNASERLDRLEMTVFHQKTTGSVSDRIKNLIAGLPDPAKSQVTTAIANFVMAQPTVNPLMVQPPAPWQEYTQPTGFSDVVAPLDMTKISPPAVNSATSALLPPPASDTSSTVTSGTTQTTQPDQVTVLEQFFFDTTYPTQNTAARLGRIETLEFGGPQIGPDTQRLKNIIAGLPPITKTELSHDLSHASGTLPSANSTTPANTPPTAQPQSQIPAQQTATQSASSPPANEIAVMQPGSPPPAKSAATEATQPSQQANAQADVATIFSGVQKLVQKFYPSAKITINGSKMHFEYKCKTEIGYYSQKKVYAPQYGGILCDISMEPGQYDKANKNRLPSEVPDGFHTNLTMAPYSSTQNDHLLVHLSYPPNMDIKFKGRFEKLIDSFNAQDIAAQSASKTAARVAILAHSAAAKAGTQAAALKASQDYEAAYQAAFGAPNMSEHQFSDGVCRIMMPDALQSNNGAELGMAKTTYSAQGVGGNFTLSFLTLPSLPTTAADTSKLLDSVSSDLTQQIQGSGITQGFDSLKGAPGRQISFSSISGKPGDSGLVRIYIACAIPTYYASQPVLDEYGNPCVDNDGNPVTQWILTRGAPKYFVYELSAIGQQQWLSSPAVQNFVSSFQYNDGTVPWIMGAGQVLPLH